MDFICVLSKDGWREVMEKLIPSGQPGSDGIYSKEECQEIYTFLDGANEHLVHPLGDHLIRWNGLRNNEFILESLCCELDGSHWLLVWNDSDGSEDGMPWCGKNGGFDNEPFGLYVRQELVSTDKSFDEFQMAPYRLIAK
jgi:hypothetical protein